MIQSPLVWTGTGLSHQGQVRTSNQDALGIDNDRGLWIVADGMGGYIGGQVASELAVSAIRDRLQAVPATNPVSADQFPLATAILTEAIAAAKTAIQDRISQDPDLRHMGTTVVTAWFLAESAPVLAIAHVGDSRAYLIRNGQLHTLTTDHSLVQQLVTEGHLTVEQAQDHPKKNVLVRALGLNFPSTPDIAIHRLEPEDRVLLCTDGLTKMLPDQTILTIILESKHNAEEACRQLIEQANAAGGIDNTTVLLLTPQPPNSAPS